MPTRLPRLARVTSAYCTHLVARAPLVAVAAAVVALACADSITGPELPREGRPAAAYTNVGPSLAAQFRVVTANPVPKQALTVDASASNGPNPMTTFTWSWGDATPNTTRSSPTGGVHAYDAAGTYQITLTVADGTGATASTQQAVTVGGGSGADMQWAPTALYAGGTATFTAEGGGDPAGNPVAYRWQFSDGVTDTTRVMHRSFATAGTYKVSLTFQYVAAPAKTIWRTFTVATAAAPAGAVVWLRSDQVTTDGGNVVTAWPNAGGGAATAPADASRPTLVANALNGRPLVHFDGADDHVVVPNVTLGAFTVVMAARVAATQPSLGMLYEHGQDTNVGDGSYLTTSNNATMVVRRNGTHTAHAYVANWAHDGTARVVTQTFGGTWVSQQLYLNGVAQSLEPAPPNVPQNLAAAAVTLPLYVGCRAGPVACTGLDLGEMLVYPRLLSDAERTQAEAYLAQKFGIALGTNLPSSTGDVNGVTGAVLWLKADDGVLADATGAVHQWADASGRRWLVRQDTVSRRPQFSAGAANGKPAVHFSGAQHLTTLQAIDLLGGATDFTVAAVYRIDPAQPVGVIADYGAAARSRNWTLRSALSSEWPTVSPTTQLLWCGTSCGGATGNMPPQPEALALELVVKTGATMATYVNGVQAATGATGAVMIPAAVPFSVGAAPGAASPRWLTGDVAELIVFPRALSGSDRAKVERALQVKYGLRLNNQAPTTPALDCGNPLRLVAATVTCTASGSTDPEGAGAIRYSWSVATGRGTIGASPFATATYSMASAGQVWAAVRAADADGAPSDSTRTLLSFLGAATGPGGVAGAGLWLRADSGVVTSDGSHVTRWYDWSGHGHAGVPVGSEPQAPQWSTSAFNGRPGVTFGAGVNPIAVPWSADFTGAPHTIVAVVLPTTGPTDAVQTPYFSRDDASGVTRGTFLYLLPSTSAAKWEVGLGNGTTSSWHEQPAGGATAGTPVITTHRYGQPGSDFFLQGALVASDPTFGGYAPNPSQPFYLGASGVVGQPFLGVIAELAIYPRALSDAERQSVEQALASKYGLTVATAAPVADPALWYRADVGVVRTGSAVSAWEDASGHLRRATQPTGAAQPAYVESAINGKPALRFSGGQSLGFDGSVLTNSDYTIFVVEQRRAAKSMNCVIGGTGGSARGILAVGYRTDNDFWVTDNAGDLDGGVPVTAGAAPAVSTVRLSGTTHAVFRNGLLLTQQAGAAQVASFAGAAVGANPVQSAGGYFNGDIAEILIYRRALSDLERQTVEASLASRYALSLASPSTSTPGGVAGAALWLKADDASFATASGTAVANGSAVVVWNDASGNGRNASNFLSSSASYLTTSAGGKPALRFDGVSGFLRIPYDPTFNAARSTVFAVLTPRVGAKAGTSSYQAPLASRRTGPTGPLGYNMYLTPADYGGTWAGWYANTAAGWMFVNGPAAVAGRTAALVQRYDGAATTFYVNGTLQGSSAGTHAANDQAPFYVGAGQDGGFPFDGDISEVIVFPRALTDAERAAVEQYLATKYTLTLGSALRAPLAAAPALVAQDTSAVTLRREARTALPLAPRGPRHASTPPRRGSTRPRPAPARPTTHDGAAPVRSRGVRRAA